MTLLSHHRGLPLPLALAIGIVFVLSPGISTRAAASNNEGHCDLPEFKDCENCGSIDFQAKYFYGCGVLIQDTDIRIDLSHHNLTGLSEGFVDILFGLDTDYEEVTVDLSRNFIDCFEYPNISDYCDPNAQLSCSDFTNEAICNSYPPCSYDGAGNKCIFGTVNTTYSSSFVPVLSESSQTEDSSNSSTDDSDSIWEVTKNTTIRFYIRLSSDDFPGMTDTRIHEHIISSVTEDICKNIGVTEKSFVVMVAIEYAKTRGRDMDIDIIVAFTGEDRNRYADSLIEKHMAGTLASSNPYLKDARIVSIDRGDRSIRTKTSSGLGKLGTGAWVGIGVAGGVFIVVIIVEIVVVGKETKKQRAREAERLAMLQAMNDFEEDENKMGGDKNSRKASIDEKKSSSSSSEDTSSFSSEDIFSDAFNSSGSDSDYSSDSYESSSEEEN